MTAPTTAATGLLDELTSLGVELWSEDGQIRFRAPQGVLTEERRAALRAHKQQVVALLEAEDAAGTVIADPAAAHEPFPLTDVQSAYLLGRRDPFGHGGVACHGYLEIHYPRLDPAALEDAWNALIARHDMLRAIVHEDGYQQVLPEVERCRIAVTDLRDTPQRRDAHVAEVRADLGHRTYDTARWPLFELRVTRLPDEDVLHFSLDSLIADWASAAVLFDELDTLLASTDPADPTALPRPAITFRDYVLAERALRDTARHRRDRDYWRSRLASLPPAPDLPLVTTAADEAPRFARLSHRLPAPAWERLRGQAATRGLTPTTVVLAAYVSVLERWSRRKSFTVNLTLLNRMPLHPDVDHLVGDFTSVTLLAAEAQTGAAPAERAKRLAERLFTDLDHRLYSGVEVIRDLTRVRGRDAALMPYVFTSSLGLGPGSSESSGRTLGHGITQTPQVFLDCQVGDGSGDLEVNWDIRQGVLPEGMAEDMLAAFGALLDTLAADPDAWDRPDPVALPAWQMEERRAANDTAGPLPDGLLHEGFFARAVLTPDAPALLGAFGTVTFGELARHAGAVAEALRGAGRTGGERIAVVMDKGPEQAAAVLGVLLAGCVYVPVDTTQPALRRARLLTAAGVRHVLTQSWVGEGEGRPEGVERTDVDRLTPIGSIPVPTDDGDPGRPAYVIYTSGSTGDPKGVVTSHRAALNTVDDINERFAVTGADRVLQLAALGFDLSVYDVFGALAAGAALVLPDPARGADPSHWAELAAEHGVTLWNSVPAQLHMLADYLTTEPLELPALRLALLSGDWIPVTLPARLRTLLPGLSPMSLGGATEAAIWSIHHPITEADDGRTSIPYGVPLRNQGWRVLDEDGRDCPVWVPGELCITGEGLALGYLDDPDLTARRFPDHPRDGQRLYRTGDVGRYLPGGEIEFLGREDNQVKIRGHRIELGEVEAALLAHPAAGAAAAVVSDQNGERMLLGFVEPAPRTAPDETARDTRLRTAVQRYADRVLPAVDPGRIDAHHRALRRAALLTMLDALRRRGALTGEARSAEEMLDAARVAARHRWLVRQWLTALADDGMLSRDAEGRYRTTGETGAEDEAARAWDEVARGVADGLCTDDYLAYHRAHAERLDDLLDDRVSPFDLLFPEGDDAPARAVYQDDALSRHLNAAVAAVVHRRTAEHDGPGPVRVVELGAGIGATTESVLPLLDGFDEDYLFTDVSPSFLPRARAAFHGRGLRFGVVDIDRDPLQQGLPPNSADIVVCAGVLNSARDTARAVRHAVEILAPGGLLVVTEPVGAHPHILLTQGFMMEPAGGDREAGACPLLDADAWHELFEKAGATHVLSLPGSGHAFETAGHRLFVLRAKTDRTPVRPEEVAAFAAERLTAAMVPGHLQIVDALPVTANGKIDRRALAGRRPGELAGAEVDAPGTDAGLEERLCALWATALGISALAPQDNFYDHGADSLILARVAGRLREEIPEAAAFTYDTLLRQMLNEPTVQALARALRTSAAAAGTPGAEETRDTAGNALLVPFGGAPHPDGTVRVMFHAALGTLDYFQHIGRTLAAQDLGPVIGVAVADAEVYTATPPERLVATVADRYAQRLADEGYTRFQLIGYCLGGLLATEVARRLTERGLRVDDLTLVDGIPMFLDTDEELAYESIFVPNLGLDPVPAVFGPGVADEDVYRAVELLTERGGGRIAAGELAALDKDEETAGDEGLAAVAAAARRAAERTQDERLAAYARAAENNAQVPVDAELVPALFRTCRHSMKAAHLQLEPYAGDMTFLRCEEQQSFGVTGGVGHYAEPFWAETCLGRFTVTDVPGNHFSVIQPPHVHVVAEHLAAPLRPSGRDTEPGQKTEPGRDAKGDTP
ncbi:amino acid adenylation domain-containing protein [Streptomyces tubercidicus]|uniref:non-ribosomal peptide synthetase n=1 Tax=Streptomyces tubercidicus TaxID=47759 RepID=UPI003465E480